MRLNLGSGPQAVPGWLNVDYALAMRLRWLPFSNRAFRNEWDKSLFLYDLTRPFPWGDATADAIYSSHFLEHLSAADGAHFLRECRRVLKPGAPIRIVVPDLAPIVEQYRLGTLPAEDFVEVLQCGYTKTGWKKALAPLVEFPHKTMYDTAALCRAMGAAGFNARSAPPFASAIDDIAAIEHDDRVKGAVIVEAIG